jgi:UDP-N-acetylmuramate dehydrogenase
VTREAGGLSVAEAILRETCGDRVRIRFPMAPLTTFRIGGPAALYLEAADAADLDAASRAVRGSGIPVIVIGKGSNVLVADGGFPGLVIRLGRGFRWVARDGDRLRAGAATPLPALAGEALRHGLDGLAFGVAIPATLGGSVRMNAGAHDEEIGDVIGEIDILRLGSGDRDTMDRATAGFAYRATALPEDAVVTGARLDLRPGDPARIRERMDEARAWRRATQPLAEPNCGSVFTNPPGDHAARLIEEAGCKGLRVGGAAVSTKHANFIVASPGTRATDVVELIGEVRARVAKASGVELVPEVRVVGGTLDG